MCGIGVTQNKVEEADEVRCRFAGDSQSDHICILNAYKVCLGVWCVCVCVCVHCTTLSFSSRAGRRPSRGEDGTRQDLTVGTSFFPTKH